MAIRSIIRRSLLAAVTCVPRVRWCPSTLLSLASPSRRASFAVSSSTPWVSSFAFPFVLICDEKVWFVRRLLFDSTIIFLFLSTSLSSGIFHLLLYSSLHFLLLLMLIVFGFHFILLLREYPGMDHQDGSKGGDENLRRHRSTCHRKVRSPPFFSFSWTL